MISLTFLSLSALAGGGGIKWADLGDSCLGPSPFTPNSGACCEPMLRADFMSARCVNVPALLSDIEDNAFIQMNVGGKVRIYWVKDGERHLIPDKSTAESWFSDRGNELCEQVYSVPALLGETTPEGNHVTLRPGSGIIKISSEAKLYVVEEPSILRRITYAQAEDIYGPSWILYVRTVNDFTFLDYCIGPDLMAGEPYDWQTVSDGAMLSDAVGVPICPRADRNESLP